MTDKITFGSLGDTSEIEPRGFIKAHKEKAVKVKQDRKPKNNEEKPNKGFSIYFTQTQLDILDEKADGRSRSKFIRDFLSKNDFFKR